MKHFIMVICAITAFTFGQAQDVAVSTSSANTGSSTAAFSRAETSYDFGKTKVGIPVSYELGLPIPAWFPSSSLR
jgi:hypothetical protein